MKKIIARMWLGILAVGLLYAICLVPGMSLIIASVAVMVFTGWSIHEC